MKDEDRIVIARAVLPEAIPNSRCGDCFAKNARNDTHASSFIFHPSAFPLYHNIALDKNIDFARGTW